MAVVWGQVVDYLTGLLPSLPGWDQVAVFDGPPNTGDDPTDWATVGYVADDSAGTFQLDHTEDYLFTETGVVRVDVTCQSGDDTLAPLRSRLFGYVSALDAALRRDQSLGGLTMAGSALLASEDVRSYSNGQGVAMSVVCSVTYTAQTPFPG